MARSMVTTSSEHGARLGTPGRFADDAQRVRAAGGRDRGVQPEHVREHWSRRALLKPGTTPTGARWSRIASRARRTEESSAARFGNTPGIEAPPASRAASSGIAAVANCLSPDGSEFHRSFLAQRDQVLVDQRLLQPGHLAERATADVRQAARAVLPGGLRWSTRRSPTPGWMIFARSGPGEPAGRAPGWRWSARSARWSR